MHSFFMNARQGAGQINKIKWQTHYKASGSQAVRQAGIRRQVAGEWNGRAKWQRHGNKSATGSTCSNNATLAAQNTAHCAAHCTKKWPTMRAVQKAQWWLNTRLAAVVTSLPLPLRSSYFSLLAAPLTCFLLLLHCSLAVAKCQRPWRRCLHWGIDAR